MNKRKLFSTSVLVISLLVITTVTLTLIFWGKDSIEMNMPVYAGNYCFATKMAAKVITKLSAPSVGNLPSWLTEEDRSNFKKSVRAIQDGDWEGVLLYLAVLSKELKDRGRSVNELATQIKWQLIPSLAAGWVASNLLPFLVAFVGVLFLWLLHRLWWSPMIFLRWIAKLIGGVLAYYVGTFIILLVGGIFLRIWFGDYPDTLAVFTELLVWLGFALTAGLVTSIGVAKKGPMGSGKIIKKLRKQVTDLGDTPVA